MIVLDYQDRRPLYEQIVEKFRHLILNGHSINSILRQIFYHPFKERNSTILPSPSVFIIPKRLASFIGTGSTAIVQSALFAL